MANVVSHLVTVTGSSEAVRAFADRMIVRRKGGPTFDFGALAPMPAVFDGTESSSTASDGLIILGVDHLPDPLMSTGTVGEQAERMFAYPWVQEAGVTDRAGLVALLKERAKADGGVERRFKLARAAIAAFEETGHVTAGGWAIEHWGCDGVRDFEITRDEPGRLEFSLGTAWASPERIWDLIAETFPDVVVAVVGFEEAWHFAVSGEIAGGRNGVQDVEPTPELYERVYGEPYVEEPEAEDDDAADAEAAEAERHVRATPVRREGTFARLSKTVNWDLVGWILAAFVALGYALFWR